MSDEIINKNITIASVEQKTATNGNLFYKIKDENDLSYLLWPMKKDKTELAAATYLKSFGLEAVGKTVSIGYTEEEYEKEGRTNIGRKIIGMRAPKEGVPEVRQSECDCNSRLMALEASVGALQAKMGIDAPLPPKTVTEPPTPFDSNVSQTARPGDPNYVDPSTIPF